MSINNRAADKNAWDGSVPSRWLIPTLFLAGRLILILNLPIEGLAGYGDYWNFYRLASLGRPFLDLWVEFPPLFPLLSRGLFLLIGGREHAYQYLLAIFLSLVQAGSLYLFLGLAADWHGREKARLRGWGYALLLVGLGYGWWYFDPLAVFAMLLGLRWSFQERDARAGVALAAGVLTKWFPILALAAVWRARPARRAAVTTAMTLGLTLLVWGGMYLRAPEMTAASLSSQINKGSWETVWALVDGNLATGNFSPDADRTRPETALASPGADPRIPPLVTLALFGGLGVVLLFTPGSGNSFGEIGRLGLVWCLFLLWSPGYSPQWVLYLLPLILLALPARTGLLLAVTLLSINLLEWPLLLSRGLFWTLWGLIPLRTVLIALLGVEFWRAWRRTRIGQEPAPNPHPFPLPSPSSTGSDPGIHP